MLKFMKLTIFFMLLLHTAVSVGIAGECKEFIELLPVKEVAKVYDASESWVVGNLKINLWQLPTPEGKGRKIGELLPGSRALLIEERSEDYKIMSPFDKSVGWVNKVQVKGKLFQDTETFIRCNPRKKG